MTAADADQQGALADAQPLFPKNPQIGLTLVTPTRRSSHAAGPDRAQSACVPSSTSRSERLRAEKLENWERPQRWRDIRYDDWIGYTTAPQPVLSW